MPELRQNITNKEWVIIATERARRPEDFIKKITAPENIPAHSPTCPFCPGNESKTPKETFIVKGENGWKIRVTPNKFPALVPEGSKERCFNGIKRRMDGIGLHEVIIETPVHNAVTALLLKEDLAAIIRTYLNRYLHALEDERIDLVTIFKNHGKTAGTSLEHPHSQLIATPVVPLYLRQRIAEAMSYYDEYGECVFCRIIREEIALKERLICESAHFAALTVYASARPFHIWVVPKRHLASFGGISGEEIDDLASLLKTVLSKLYYGLNDPDFNYNIHSLPGKVRDNDFYHWYISIVPRVTEIAGFELGSGMYINTSLPESDAEFLRNVPVNR